MTQAPEALILDLVEWVARKPRPYIDTLDVWRTSCPRLTVWEDTVDLGYVERTMLDGNGLSVVATAAGLQFLASHGRIAKSGSLKL